MRRILIAGSRNIDPSHTAFDDALAILRNGNHEREEFIVVTGGARGVDTAGEWWANARKHENEVHQANWDKYGNRAGYIRNQEMVDSGIDLAMIFWDGESKGTAHTMKMLREASVSHIVVIQYAH